MTKQLWAGYEVTAQVVLDTGINSLADGGNKLSAEIDNTSNLFVFEDLTLLLESFSATLNVDSHVKIYLLPTIDGTNYPDGGDSVDPADSNEVYPMIFDGSVATVQRNDIRGVVLPPGKYKYLLMNEMGGALAGSGNILSRRPYNLKST